MTTLPKRNSPALESLDYLRLESLPHLNILSNSDHISHSNDVDIDLQLPIHNNFDYYSINEFHTSLEIQNLKDHNYFSFMHINLRNLSANFDNLSVMLEELQFPFSIMGLSETKIKKDNICLLNTNLSGYNFVSQPTFSNAGGVALIDEVSFVNWETICSSNNDVNEIFQRFYSTIIQIIDKHAPDKKLSKKQIKFKSKPWITKGIKVSISTKNKLFKRYLKTKKHGATYGPK